MENGKMELVITPLQKMEAIKFNYEELKQGLSDSLQKYKGLTYTDETIKDAKTDRAKLNKLSKALNDEKIKIKNEFMVPYTDFEDKIKELIGLVAEPTAEIDKQVKLYEEKKKEEKRQEITTLFNDNIDNLIGLVNLDRIYNERWENATYKLADIEKEIRDLVNKVNNDLKVIEELKSDYEVQLKDTYLKTFDLGQALVEKSRLEKQTELLNKQKEEVAKNEEVAVSTSYASGIAISELNVDLSEKEDMLSVTFKVVTTSSKLKALGNYMKENGIKYGRAE